MAEIGKVVSAKLFNGVSGFETIGRLKTATEEIDITILNGSTNPLWQKESAIVLVECKTGVQNAEKMSMLFFEIRSETAKTVATSDFLFHGTDLPKQ